MIRKFSSIVACVALASGLGGCATFQSIASSLGVPPATITLIQQLAVSSCGFLPAVETVIGIVTGGASIPEAEIANQICQAAITNQAPAGMQVGRFGAPAGGAHAYGAPPPSNAKVGAVAVKGIFVR